MRRSSDAGLPVLLAGIYDFWTHDPADSAKKDVDGRNKSGHDEVPIALRSIRSTVCETASPAIDAALSRCANGGNSHSSCPAPVPRLSGMISA